MPNKTSNNLLYIKWALKYQAEEIFLEETSTWVLKKEEAVVSWCQATGMFPKPLDAFFCSTKVPNAGKSALKEKEDWCLRKVYLNFRPDDFLRTGEMEALVQF